MRTIRVTGRGQIRLHPDMTRIVMDLKGRYMDYGEALRHSAEDTEILRESLEGLGFDRADLKTLSFDVDTEYEYADEKRYQRRFAGYEYHHKLKVEFESDNKRLGRVIYMLANGMVSPEFHIAYFVKDQEAAKNELLADAVADAKEKAAVLSRAAGVALKDIQTVDYSWGEVRFESRMMECLPMADCASGSGNSYDMDIEPDDIDASDTVTVIWEIG